MKRLAIVSVLSLAACASEPEMPVLAAQPETAGVAAPATAAAPGGPWVVVEDYAAESVGVPTSPYLGRVVTLDQARAVDPAGRLCKFPAYSQSETAAAAALGNPPQPQAAQDASPRKILAVTCAGRPFLTVVALPDGTWLTRANGWVLKLAKEAPRPAPAVAEKPAAPAKIAARPDPRTLVYLASYKSETAARKGFKVLAKASPILAGQQPVTQSVDLGKTGSWVRLYGLAASDAERASICGQLGKRVDECGARNRE